MAKRFKITANGKVLFRGAGRRHLLQGKNPKRRLTDPELRQRERANIEAALTKSEWRVHGPVGAAELLRINPNTLVSRIRKLGLKKPA